MHHHTALQGYISDQSITDDSVKVVKLININAEMAKVTELPSPMENNEKWKVDGPEPTISGIVLT